MSKLGLPSDASRGEMYHAIGPEFKDQMGRLFKEAGLEINMDCQITPTMDSHRLAWFAAEQDSEKGEAMWRALSQRYFEGKNTTDKALQLSDHALLLECADEVGLDRDEAVAVLQSDRYRQEIVACVELMHRKGINSIPVLIFEVPGVARGDVWSAGAAPAEGRVVHHGSGSVKEFTSILRLLHGAGMAAAGA